MESAAGTFRQGPKIVARRPGAQSGACFARRHRHNGRVNITRFVQVLYELVMLVLGLLIAFLALNRGFQPPRGLAWWIVVGALLIIWGWRTWVRRGQYDQPLVRALQWVRSGSLVLAGVVMIAMMWMALGDARLMLIAVGGVLVVRGVVGAALATVSLLR